MKIVPLQIASASSAHLLVLLHSTPAARERSPDNRLWVPPIAVRQSFHFQWPASTLRKVFREGKRRAHIGYTPRTVGWWQVWRSWSHNKTAGAGDAFQPVEPEAVRGPNGAQTGIAARLYGIAPISDLSTRSWVFGARRSDPGERNRSSLAAGESPMPRAPHRIHGPQVTFQGWQRSRGGRAGSAGAPRRFYRHHSRTPVPPRQKRRQQRDGDQTGRKRAEDRHESNRLQARIVREADRPEADDRR